MIQHKSKENPMDSYGASLGEQSHQAVQHPSTAAAPHVAVAAFARHFSRGRAAAKAHPARGVGALECPQWNGWPEAQLHHACKQFRI